MLLVVKIIFGRHFSELQSQLVLLCDKLPISWCLKHFLMLTDSVVQDSEQAEQ